MEELAEDATLGLLIRHALTASSVLIVLLLLQRFECGHPAGALSRGKDGNQHVAESGSIAAAKGELTRRRGAFSVEVGGVWFGSLMVRDSRRLIWRLVM